MNLLNKPAEMLETAGELALLFVGTIRHTFTKDFPVLLLMHQIVRIGIGSIVVILVTTFFTGMVMSMQISLLLESMLTGISQFTGSAVGLAMVKELAPMLVGLVTAGRIGSAVTAEVGTMEITEQISALKTLNTNPVAYIAVPRFWAGVITLPMLTLLGDIMGVLGGAVVNSVVFDLNIATYFERSIEFTKMGDVVGGLIKASVFGGIIILVACFVGFKTSGGAEGVGKSTTESVVLSFILILGSDVVLTYILSAFGM